MVYKTIALPAELLRRALDCRRSRVVCLGHGLSERTSILGSMRHPKEIGDRTTLAVMFALKLRGETVLVPFGENVRYDLVADNGRRLSRIQCKTGRLRNGAIHFRVCSSYAHHPNPRGDAKRDYKGQIDEFGVFCPDTGTVYRIPIDDMPNERTASLRVEPPRNAQIKNVRMAITYEVARIDVY